MAIHCKLKSVARALQLACALATPAWASKDVTIAISAELTSMDPLDTNDRSTQSITKAIYEGLYTFDKDMQIVPALAESYKVTGGGRIYTFKLRPGVKFHDGTPFDAEAVKVNFERRTSPEARSQRTAMFKHLISVEAVGPLTVRFTLSDAVASFINVIAHPEALIVSPTALATYGTEIGKHPVGTGPFEFVDWEPAVRLKVKKFAGYWKPGLPKIDTLAWLFMIDDNQRTSALQTGQVDVVTALPYQSIALARALPGIEVVSVPSIIQRYITLNMLVKPFDSHLVRLALNYALDKQALSKVAYAGNAAPAEGVIPPGGEYAVKLGPWPYDPHLARELLRKAGYENGFETSLWSSHNNSINTRILSAVQLQLAQVGIKVNTFSFSGDQRLARVIHVARPETNEVRMYLTTWSSATGTADWALRPLLSTSAWPPLLFNTSYYSNAAVDVDLEAALNSTSRTEQARLYRRVQQTVWADAPLVFLVTERVVYAHSKRVTGIYVTKSGFIVVDDADVN